MEGGQEGQEEDEEGGREAGLRLTSRLHRSCRGRELGSGEGNYIRTCETGHIFG